VQHVEINRLRSGEMIFHNGFVDFAVRNPSSIQIAKSQWNWMGGTISATDAQINPQASELSLVVEAKGLQLKQLLDFFAEDYARGGGRVDARLPVFVQGWRIGFGEGQIENIGGGSVQIIDADTIADAIGESKDPVQSAQRDEIARALRDFEYDVLRADLVYERERGLIAHVDLQGRGRTGARQPLHVEINIDGLDQALLYYLGIQRKLSSATGNDG
jgi:hypothetical protein